MGAHSLGKATREHAGFDGVWTPGDNFIKKFRDTFFVVLFVAFLLLQFGIIIILSKEYRSKSCL